MLTNEEPLARQKRRCCSMLALATIVAAGSLAQQPVDSVTLTANPLMLEDAVSIALRENASLASLGAQAEALEAVPAQAGALPDPMVGIAAMNLPTDTFDFDQEPMTQLQLSFSQAIPFPGKRQLMREAARHEASAARLRIEERLLTLAADVRSTWWMLFSLDRTLEIIEQNKLLMRDFIEIAQTKYRVGNGLQQDVLLAQLELSRLLDRELRTEGMRSAMQSTLNHYLNRPGDRRVGLPVNPPNELLPVVPPQAALLEQAAARPQLSGQMALVDAARARLDLANKNLRPDFRVGLAYGIRDGRNPLSGEDRPDFLSLNFSVSVPLYADAKQRSAVREQTHEVSQRRHTLNDTQRSIEAAVARHRYEYQSASSQVELIRGAIIPQAQQTVGSMLAAYQTNQVDFLNVVSAQITLYNAQINYWEALSNAKAALARLAAAVGEEALYE